MPTLLRAQGFIWIAPGRTGLPDVSEQGMPLTGWSLSLFLQINGPESRSRLPGHSLMERANKGSRLRQRQTPALEPEKTQLLLMFCIR